ncbi:MAG TPA: DUF5329 family protein [Thermoanaerobaculia bacterium]
MTEPSRFRVRCSRSIRLALAVVVVLARPAAAMPASVRPVAEQTKIDFLIAEVKKSKDVFIRNGQEYTGARASSHLAWKLRFAGKRVQTATEFILGVGSKSEESGKLYEVRTKDGHREPLRDWLLARLHLYEAARAPTPPPVTPAVQ